MILSLTNCLDAITTTPAGMAAATVNTTTTSTATINYYRPISFEHKISHVSFYSIFYNRPGILYILDLRQILKLFNLIQSYLYTWGGYHSTLGCHYLRCMSKEYHHPAHTLTLYN